MGTCGHEHCGNYDINQRLVVPESKKLRLARISHTASRLEAVSGGPRLVGTGLALDWGRDWPGMRVQRVPAGICESKGRSVGVAERAAAAAAIVTLPLPTIARRQPVLKARCK